MSKRRTRRPVSPREIRAHNPPDSSSLDALERGVRPVDLDIAEGQERVELADPPHLSARELTEDTSPDPPGPPDKR